MIDNTKAQRHKRTQNYFTDPIYTANGSLRSVKRTLYSATKNLRKDGEEIRREVRNNLFYLTDNNLN